MIIPLLNSDVDPEMRQLSRKELEGNGHEDSGRDALSRRKHSSKNKTRRKKKQNRGKLLPSKVVVTSSETTAAPVAADIQLLQACRQREWKTAHDIVIRHGQDSSSQLIPTTGSTSFTSSTEKTALHYACQYGQEKLFHLLLTHVASSSYSPSDLETLLLNKVQSQQNWNVLHFACAASAAYPSSSLKIVQTILHYCNNASSSSPTLLETLMIAQDDYLSTPLHIAAFFESLDIVHVLLLQQTPSSASSCCCRITDINGDTPLSIAVAGHNPTLVHLFLAHDIKQRQQSFSRGQQDITQVRGVDGNTALHVACGDFTNQNDPLDEAPWIKERLEVVQALLKHPQSLPERRQQQTRQNPCFLENDRGESPFWMTAMSGSETERQEAETCSRLSVLFEMIRHDPNSVLMEQIQ